MTTAQIAVPVRAKELTVAHPPSEQKLEVQSRNSGDLERHVGAVARGRS